jgi:hypothetical protein
MAGVRASVHASPKRPPVKPAFTVFKLEGTTTKRKARMVPVKGPDGEPLKDKNGNHKHRLEMFTETVPLGYLVQFPRGHSVSYLTYQELEAAGYTDTEVPLLQFFGQGDAEEVGVIPNIIGVAAKNRKEKSDA